MEGWHLVCSNGSWAPLRELCRMMWNEQLATSEVAGLQSSYQKESGIP